MGMSAATEMWYPAVIGAGIATTPRRAPLVQLGHTHITLHSSLMYHATLSLLPSPVLPVLDFCARLVAIRPLSRPFHRRRRVPSCGAHRFQTDRGSIERYSTTHPAGSALYYKNRKDYILKGRVRFYHRPARQRSENCYRGPVRKRGCGRGCINLPV